MDIINLSKQSDLDFHGVEAFKSLRSNIQFCGSDIKVIGITSCTPSEGKSSVSMNLAEAFADAGKKVVYIDADLRKSAILGRYHVNNKVNGLTLYLSGMNKRDSIVYKTNIQNLDMIFTGPVPPNPSELLGGEKFAQLISQLKDSYDYVIIDTPPLGSIIDGAVVARVCDGMVMIIEAKTISYKFAQKVLKQLERTGCRILGTVLNKVDMGDKGYYSKYYGKYYG